MSVCARVTYIFFVCFLCRVFGKEPISTKSCMHYYEKGVESYLDNKYDSCVLNFETALAKYHEYTQKLNNCRLKCHQEAKLSEPLYPVDIENLLFYEQTIKNTLCIVNCKQNYKNVFTGFNINKETEKLFEDKKPYEYLHICYFQTNQLQKAASAAFTYLVYHPDDKIMSANLKHYSDMEGVDITEIVNFEAKDFVYLYIHGVNAYEQENWNEVIQYMEDSLLSYQQAEEECRVQCEGPFDQGWYPDFTPSIANHFTFCLKCKQQCVKKLNSLNGEKHEDLLPSHYHYLQYAYFKTGNLRATCAAVASYLLFYPDDETMLSNMKYYMQLPKGSYDLFIPRPEAVTYIRRQIYERKIMNFIISEFRPEKKSKQSSSEELKYRVILNETQLQGSRRFLSDGLVTDRDCTVLVSIAKMFAKLGDGYQGKPSPHTAMEKFEGITINRASLLVYFGLLDPKYLALFLKLTEYAKQKVEEYFNIKRKLHFTYTHLVCRSALPESSSNRTDFSHNIHADNCNLLGPDICEKSEPAYTWRDYSAIIYLNNDFEGGEFIFSADPFGNKIQSLVKPKCGRMVAFSSGMENLHGVKAVKSGSRCALAIWFTFDRKFEQTEIFHAYELLKNFKST